ncbi:hypothetical protein BABINDRAFT_163553 [Babjeviella inositovora NRRL Y-12698]|uniref:Major facilitator superfamily (MFS) profile domain-containing protein n=1 Tax=Babjeviella inositovora NRRL Y-12698 TaxID=984486 RepID=A0A1E3QKN4_9ASCO|nr:uncharacterized protein BABINDRAFT_163553 [Babjeviella inositovora NRRL Y-12698]ODQ77557.1 hypothetical protein BABINDRAFT_163553 [Babjeviella inositovora NRRL Y-12698]
MTTNITDSTAAYAEPQYPPVGEPVSEGDRWYDRRFSKHLPPYSNAMVQVIFVSFVCFLTTGMFNALLGVGGLGGIDIHTSDLANMSLYTTFLVLGFVSGTIINMIGVRYALCFGSLGYALYAGLLLCFVHTENSGFVIALGAILGICASCLWSAQGTIMLSYPTENNKGKAIMTFWIIFNLGAVIGSVIPLAQNIHDKESKPTDGTFAAFLALMCCGSLVALLLLPVSKVMKSDGTRVEAPQNPLLKKELLELFHILKTEPMIYTLFPMFFASNWFYTYQQSDFNAGHFNLRTRSLNSLLYWLMQMVGALFIGFLLDWARFSRKMRARIGWVVLFSCTMAIWGGGFKFQQGFTRESVESMTKIDFTDRSYIGPMFLFMFYGAFDAIWQSFVYWLLGALSNKPRKAALYAGFYKGIQSAGAAIIWRLDSLGKLYMAIFGSTWGLLAGSLLIAAPMVFIYVTDHTVEDGQLSIEDDADSHSQQKSESSYVEVAHVGK